MISFFNRKDHGWRDAYNPLRGLSMPRLVSLLEAGERGQYADLQWLYHYMERSDSMIASVLQRRRAALLSVDWDIRRVTDSVHSWQGAVGSWFGAQWGWALDSVWPVLGDFDGDGRADLCVYDAGSGKWYIRRSSDGRTTNGAAWGWRGVMPPAFP